MSITDHHPNGETIRFTITPQPTADERDAVVAALTVLLLDDQAGTLNESTAPVSRWRQVGRQVSMRGSNGADVSGWGRSPR